MPRVSAGHLDVVLERLADYTENREVIRQKVLGALLYPIVLTVMCFAIVSILLVFVGWKRSRRGCPLTSNLDDNQRVAHAHEHRRLRQVVRTSRTRFIR